MKLKLILLISILFFSILANTDIIKIVDTQETNEGYEDWLNRFTYIESIPINNLHSNNTLTISTQPKVFWDNISESWKTLQLIDNRDSDNPHFTLRNSQISAKIGISNDWDIEGVLYYNPDMTKRICAEFWTVQGYLNNEWISLQSNYYSFELNYIEGKFINLTGIFRIYYNSIETGRLAISYILTPFSYLKQQIKYVSVIAQQTELRFIKSYIGIAGKTIQYRLGERVITLNETQIETNFLRFVDSENPSLVFLTDRLESLGHFEGLEENQTWINDYIKGIRLKLVEYWNKELVRCDIAIGNYIINQNELIQIFLNSTSTYEVGQSSDDCTSDVDDNYMHSLSNSWGGFPRDSDGSSERWSGFRFQVDLDVTVSSAYLNLSAYSGYSNTIYTKIYGEDSDSANTFSTWWDFYGVRDRTSESVDWDISSSWTSGNWYQTPDISDIIQEIFDRGGWSANNYLVIFIQNDGTTGTTRRNVRTYDYSGSYEPKLVITYVSNNPPVNESFEILDLDDIDNMYAEKKYYSFEVNVSDGDGYADIFYIELQVRNDSALLVSFRYDENFDFFHTYQESSVWDLDADNCIDYKTGNDIQAIFKFVCLFNCSEYTDLNVRITSYDGVDSDIDNYLDEFDTVTNLLTSLECIDSNSPDRVNEGVNTKIEFSVRYANNPSSSTMSSSYPPYIKFNQVELWDSNNNWKGEDTSIVNGNGEVTFKENVVKNETYNLYIDMNPTTYTDSEESEVEFIIWDKLNITLFATNTSCVSNEVVTIYCIVKHQYDDLISSGYIIYLDRNLTEWESFEFSDYPPSDSLESGCYYYRVNTIQEYAYGIYSFYEADIFIRWGEVSDMVETGFSIDELYLWIIIIVMIIGLAIWLLYRNYS